MKLANRRASFVFVGADGFEPPKSKDSRFTVCPIWPLWKTPFLLEKMLFFNDFFGFSMRNVTENE